jgi:hypothetical protein
VGKNNDRVLPRRFGKGHTQHQCLVKRRKFEGDRTLNDVPVGSGLGLECRVDIAPAGGNELRARDEQQ